MTEPGDDLDLFGWAEAQEKLRPVADVIDFLERRERLPRWIITRPADLDLKLRAFDRRIGLIPPAPIFPFKREA